MQPPLSENGVAELVSKVTRNSRPRGKTETTLRYAPRERLAPLSLSLSLSLALALSLSLPFLLPLRPRPRDERLRFRDLRFVRRGFPRGQAARRFIELAAVTFP